MDLYDEADQAMQEAQMADLLQREEECWRIIRKVGPFLTPAEVSTLMHECGITRKSLIDDDRR